MYHLNRLQKAILWLIRINSNNIVLKGFDVNAALWNRYRDGKVEGAAQERTKITNCRSCILYQQAIKDMPGVQIYLDPRVYERKPEAPAPNPLKKPEYIEQIRTQHNLPRLPHIKHTRLV